ncbi:MAG: 4Fe-4S cluster-binding domain-containing protein [Bacteroidales bacterium]|jgi:ABC-2 type transport system ATP-binding protein|nr:4Fe-4S cluster-binding domain-containing protein [Bacteroidales bacterium]
MIYSFTSGIGLLDGKMGISILLYHYARYVDDKKIEAYVKHLFNEVEAGLTVTTPLGFASGISGIAWGIHHLIEQGFIQVDDIDEALSDLDDALWNDTDKWKVDDHSVFDIGWYMQARMKTTGMQKEWQKKTLDWLDRIYHLFDVDHADSEVFFPVLYCCYCFHSVEELKPSVEALYDRISLIFKHPFLDEQNDPALTNFTSFLNAEWQNKCSLQEINAYFLHRFFMGEGGDIPLSYQNEIYEIVSEKKRIDEMLNPQNIGLGKYVGGLALALLQLLDETNNSQNNKTFAHSFSWVNSKKHSVSQQKPETVRYSGFGFEVHLTEHCNLNCKGCSHFSPLAKKEFMNIEVFTKDMVRMSQLLGNNDVRRIRLLGGEPLLHPQVNDFMKVASEHFPDIRRELVTNGLLLSNMSDSFWETCRTTGTIIIISRYPISIDFAGLERKSYAKGVKIIIDSNEPAKEFRKDIYDIAGLQNEQLSHSRCTLAGHCCQLNNGRFYPCTISAYFHHFNRYFNLGISLSDDNYIDIYKARSKEEFYQLIAAPVPNCKYCNLEAQEFGLKWEYSKKNMNEWT